MANSKVIQISQTPQDWTEKSYKMSGFLMKNLRELL